MAPKTIEYGLQTPLTAGGLTETATKLCELCGTLNHRDNHACFLCGWRGAFREDPEAIHLAWRRLQDEFGDVRLEHVNGRHFRSASRVAKRSRRRVVDPASCLRRFVTWRRSLSESPDPRLRAVAWLLH